MYFSALDDELEEHIEGAYNLGFGIRLTNEVDRQGLVGWVLELFAEEEFVPAGEGVRTWPLPSDVPLLKTWTSERSGNQGPWLPVVAEAVGRALDTSQQGCWQQVGRGRAGKTVGHAANLARPWSQEAPSTRSGMTFGGAACASWFSATTILSAGSGRLKW